MNKVFLASDYAHLDSDVIHGGGTDDTAALQNLLDKALEYGRIKLIMDGAALVTGLKVHSNTTIECMDKSCGFYLADHSNCSVLINSNPSFESRNTKNITLIGGTYNHNCLHQEHDIPCNDPVLTSDAPDNQNSRRWIVAVEFYGVENLLVQNLTIRDQRTFAFTVGNFKHVTIENTRIELENEIPFGNQDGFHFWGPGQFLTVKNVSGKTEDDFMNIGPDERDGVSSITDVLVDGVVLDHAWQGIRLLSRGTGLLDRVTIRNVSGTYKCFGFYVNPWFIDKTMGNFGNIIFENIDLRSEKNPLEGNYPNPPFLFSVGGDIDSLTFRNIHWYHPYDSRNIFQLGYPFYDVTYSFIRKPHIKNLLIDGLQIHEDAQHNSNTEYITVRGIIDRLTVRDVDIICSETSDTQYTFLKTNSDCEIKHFSLSRVYAESIDTLLDLTEGKISLLTINELITNKLKQRDIVGSPERLILTSNVKL